LLLLWPGFWPLGSVASPSSTACYSREQLGKSAPLRLILLIVGVPVGLPVVTTTTLAVGAAYLAKEKAIVQKLTAIDLGGTFIACALV
jgi:magnesium-transporting ATPase (P-type)